MPTTVLVVLIYLATFISVLVTDQLANVPKNQRGLNLDEAYADLHQVSRNLSNDRSLTSADCGAPALV